MDEGPAEWELVRTGRRPTEVVVAPAASSAGWVLFVGLVSVLYGVGFYFLPLPNLPEWTAGALVLLGLLFCVFRLLLSDTILWDLRNKRAFRILSFAGSKWVRRTFEGDEVFMVVVESTARGFFGLSILTRFGHRYQVLSPAHEREQVRDDAQRLARYFDVAVKEGTADVIPSARSGKSPMLKWKKRPKTTFRYAFLFLVCLIPLAMHAWEALRGSG